jgi:hypothetical protein
MDYCQITGRMYNPIGQVGGIFYEDQFQKIDRNYSEIGQKAGTTREDQFHMRDRQYKPEARGRYTRADHSKRRTEIITIRTPLLTQARERQE